MPIFVTRATSFVPKKVGRAALLTKKPWMYPTLEQRIKVKPPTRMEIGRVRANLPRMEK